MSITIKSGAKVLYQWERGVALTASTPCDILRISREDDRVTDDLYPVISGSTGTALIPDRMLTESGYLHVSRIDHADGSERVLETVRILVRHAAKPQNTASSTKEIDDMQTIRMQMAALERAAREGKFDGKDGTTPHIGGNGNWWLGDDDTGIAATGDDGITPHIGGNGNWYIGDTDTGVKATGDNGITPHIGENGNWYIGEEDTGVFARNEDVSLYADDMYTSGILEKGAMPLKILEPSGSNVIRYEIESAVVYIKGIRRARGGFTTSTQAVNFERLMANILRLNVEKGTFSWRVAEVRRDGDSLVNIDNGEIYPARSGGYYDLIPYLVHIPAGATSITQDMVEDLRTDERYCGYVRDKLAENVITTEPQELTDAEKAQARANIGAAAVGEGGGGIANITSDMVTGALGYIPVTPKQLEATNETAAAAQKAAGEAKTLAENLEITKVEMSDLESEVENQLDGAKADIAQQVIAQLGGMPVFGTVNDDNTITITSTLADGEYILVYENEDGTLDEIGSITLGGGEVTIPITWNEGYKCSYSVGASYDLVADGSYCTSDVVEVESGVAYTLRVNSTISTKLRIVGADNSGVVTESLGGEQTIAVGDNTYNFTPSSGTTQIRFRSYVGVSTKATWTLTREV